MNLVNVWRMNLFKFWRSRMTYFSFIFHVSKQTDFNVILDVSQRYKYSNLVHVYFNNQSYWTLILRSLWCFLNLFMFNNFENRLHPIYSTFSWFYVLCFRLLSAQNLDTKTRRSLQQHEANLNTQVQSRFIQVTPVYKNGERTWAHIHFII